MINNINQTRMFTSYNRLQKQGQYKASATSFKGTNTVPSSSKYESNLCMNSKGDSPIIPGFALFGVAAAYLLKGKKPQTSEIPARVPSEAPKPVAGKFETLLDRTIDVYNN